MNWRTTLNKQTGFGGIVEGINSVENALESGRVKQLLICGSYSQERLDKIIEKCTLKGIEINNINSKDWKYSERYKVAAICDPKKFISETEFSSVKGTNIVVCLNLKDPNNIGAIARSALAFNFLTIAIPKKRSSPISSAVISASAGAIENLNILTFNSIFSLLKKMKTHDYWTFGLEKLKEESISIDNIGDSNIAIIVGNEKSGLSNELTKKLDGVYSINMSDKVESLNASVAAGIFMEKIYNKNNK